MGLRDPLQQTVERPEGCGAVLPACPALSETGDGEKPDMSRVLKSSSAVGEEGAAGRFEWLNPGFMVHNASLLQFNHPDMKLTTLD